MKEQPSTSYVTQATVLPFVGNDDVANCWNWSITESRPTASLEKAMPSRVSSISQLRKTSAERHGSSVFGLEKHKSAERATPGCIPRRRPLIDVVPEVPVSKRQGAGKMVPDDSRIPH